MVPSKGGPLPSTQGPSILIRRVLLRVLLVPAPSLRVWVHGQHREVIEGGGVLVRPIPLAGCLPRGPWEPVPLGQFEVTPFKLISPLTPTLLRGTLNWAAFWPLRT